MDGLKDRLDAFMHKETSAGIVLMIATVLALLASNSPLAGLYSGFLETKLTIGVGNFEISKGLYLWINDGLMAIFFFMVGLEIKRELLQGDLSSFDKSVLPLLAAIGGMAGPALIFAALNWGHVTPLNGEDVAAIGGWAIPAATDIAFALGILALVGTRAPVSLKIFLLAIAIIDDLGAIVIIALFYTSKLSLTALALAAVGVVLAYGLNRANVRRSAPYVLVAIFVWVCVLKSGVHATLAGVLVAFTVPLRPIGDEDESLAERMEHGLHPWVNFAILPIFAFANAGVALAGMTPDMLLNPLPLGIAAGLFFGKQLGVFLITALAVLVGISSLPRGASWVQIYGLALLTGVGFTMSLFIGGLAFEQAELMNEVRMGVLMGSIASGVLGYGVLMLAGRREAAKAQPA